MKLHQQKAQISTKLLIHLINVLANLIKPPTNRFGGLENENRFIEKF